MGSDANWIRDASWTVGAGAVAMTRTAAPAPADETDGCELFTKQSDGVTTQSMNSHTAATRVSSSSTVPTAWATR
ncbi:MAG TPA: hypothetical protein VGC05_19385 [Mycobacterium sp.]